MAKTINIDKLKPGMVIIKITAQNGPVKIRKSGLVSSIDMVKALSEMGVLEVEIDPEITVEMKQPKITKSKTQQLLEDNKTVTHDIENSVSEQFNRNLFLPSVQELPEAWQYYGKKIAVIFVVIIGGLGSGWSISQFPIWKQAYFSNTQIVQAPAADQIQTQKVPQDSDQELTTEIDEHTQAQQVESQGLDSEIQNQAIEVNASELELANNIDVVPPSPESGTEPAAEPVSEPQPNISPELLKRFQDAVESLDTAQAENGDLGSTSGSYDSDYQNEILRDITPIHKLSARTLTRLPGIAFSTHMYASDPQDRWVRVNGKRVTEGQEIDRGLVLIGIEPQHVILNFEGKEFRMDALADW